MAGCGRTALDTDSEGGTVASVDVTSDGSLAIGQGGAIAGGTSATGGTRQATGGIAATGGARLVSGGVSATGGAQQASGGTSFVNGTGGSSAIAPCTYTLGTPLLLEDPFNWVVAPVPSGGYALVRAENSGANYTKNLDYTLKFARLDSNGSAANVVSAYGTLSTARGAEYSTGLAQARWLQASVDNFGLLFEVFRPTVKSSLMFAVLDRQGSGLTSPTEIAAVANTEFPQLLDLSSSFAAFWCAGGKLSYAELGNDGTIVQPAKAVTGISLPAALDSFVSNGQFDLFYWQYLQMVTDIHGAAVNSEGNLLSGPTLLSKADVTVTMHAVVDTRPGYFVSSTEQTNSASPTTHHWLTRLSDATTLNERWEFPNPIALMARYRSDIGLIESADLGPVFRVMDQQGHLQDIAIAIPGSVSESSQLYTETSGFGLFHACPSPNDIRRCYTQLVAHCIVKK